MPTNRISTAERQVVIDGLNHNIEKVCSHLFPNGKLDGAAHWCIGSIEGEPGTSLKINVAGEKIGWWKDWATDDKGDTNLVSLWAKVRGITFYAALKEAKAWLDSGGDGPSASPPVGTAPLNPTPAPRAATAETPYDWAKCVDKASVKHLNWLTKYRGLSYEFVSWLSEKKLVGFYGDDPAFPIHDEQGAVVGIHVRKKNGWVVVGKCKMRPFIVGDLAKAKTVLLFESQWDWAAVWERLSLMDNPAYAAIITRGASNGKFVEGKIPAAATVYAFTQNDQPDTHGRIPADEWFACVARHAGTQVLLVNTPKEYEDPNAWTKAGATKEAIEAAIAAATVVEVPPEKVVITPLAGPVSPFDPRSLPDCYYEPAQRQPWFIPNGSGGHVSVNDAGLGRYLRSLGIGNKALPGECLSPLETVILGLQQHHELAYAGPLAGFKAGIHRVENCNVLVTSSPTLIAPATGDWPILRKFLDGLLADGAAAQQTYLFGLLKVAYEALKIGKPRPGQAMVIAGPAGCGKSLLQSIFTLIFGGRSAKPYQYMTGGTTFNRDLFTGEHLVVEDEVPSADYRSRRNFGSKIKDITVCAKQRMHQKYRDPVTLVPFWRMSISLNDEPENLQVLPPIDESIGDKLILLKAQKRPLPMPTKTDADRERFWDTLVSELPYFLGCLLDWKIPDELRCDRYGIVHFHHPDILQVLNELAPEARLLDLIDDELFLMGGGQRVYGPWEGPARNLEKKLVDAEFADARDARRLLTYNTACGCYLARLEQKHPERISSKTKKGTRIYTIKPPEADTAAEADTAED